MLTLPQGFSTKHLQEERTNLDSSQTKIIKLQIKFILNCHLPNNILLS